MLGITKHDQHVLADYERLRQLGILTARDGIRWHLVEPVPGQYDFSSVLPMVRAARETGMQVTYELAHYGWPDDIDLFSPEFVRRFANYARAVTRLLTNETDQTPFITPINEISFWSWAAGQVACLHPFMRNQGLPLKGQLVRAAIEGIEAIWSENPRARIVSVDPLINVVSDPLRPQDVSAAETYCLSMYQAWDMLAGRVMPELGGNSRYLDIIGLN